jgi:hypothetical protein
VRRALTWLAGAVGLAALARLRARRRAERAQPELDQAAELRRKLAEQRDAGAAAEEEETAPADLEARRADVHARAQAAIDLMRDGDETADRPGGDPVA